VVPIGSVVSIRLIVTNYKINNDHTYIHINVMYYVYIIYKGDFTLKKLKPYLFVRASILHQRKLIVTDEFSVCRYPSSEEHLCFFITKYIGVFNNLFKTKFVL